MTRARESLVDPRQTPYYHCISRCVRRAFLCGYDRLTERSYEHRKYWFMERLAVVGEVFAIDVCAYAVMSNHAHLVVRLNSDAGDAWSEEQVMERWSRLYALPAMLARYQRGEELSESEQRQANEQLNTCRERLKDLSWFMRSINEPIARWANAEDGCTGRFWEGRFKTQALLDEPAILTCMSYVDLNPIRAGMAQTPEESDFTAIQQRIRDWTAADDGAPKVTQEKPKPIPLLAFGTEEPQSGPAKMPGTLSDYLELVDWTGRAILETKRGSIPADIPPILTRLAIDPGEYLDRLRESRYGFAQVVGKAETMREKAAEVGRRCFKGRSEAQTLFRTAPT